MTAEEKNLLCLFRSEKEIVRAKKGGCKCRSSTSEKVIVSTCEKKRILNLNPQEHCLPCGEWKSLDEAAKIS